MLRICPSQAVPPVPHAQDLVLRDLRGDWMAFERKRANVGHHMQCSAAAASTCTPVGTFLPIYGRVAAVPSYMLRAHVR